MIRPIDIANKLGISTSALRHYESWGIVPPVERAANGYRIYTEEHVAYFACIRAMAPGYGIQLASRVMLLLQRREAEEALWIVNEAQAALHQEKNIAEQTMRILDNKELDDIELKLPKKRKLLSIGEVAEQTGVPASAIRHWEKEGLLTPPRDQDNGYRRFSPAQVRQVLLIRTLRIAIYSLDTVKQVMKQLDENNVENARKIVKESLFYLSQRNHDQIRGAHYLYALCKLLGLLK